MFEKGLSLPYITHIFQTYVQNIINVHIPNGDILLSSTTFTIFLYT